MEYTTLPFLRQFYTIFQTAPPTPVTIWRDPILRDPVSHYVFTLPRYFFQCSFWVSGSVVLSASSHPDARIAPPMLGESWPLISPLPPRQFPPPLRVKRVPFRIVSRGRDYDRPLILSWRFLAGSGCRCLRTPAPCCVIATWILRCSLPLGRNSSQTRSSSPFGSGYATYRPAPLTRGIYFFCLSAYVSLSLY